MFWVKEWYILVYIMWIRKLVQALNRNQIDYALVGGYAVSLHGAVRGTVDVDLVIQLTEVAFTKAADVFKSLGLESRLPVDAKQVFQFREEYIKNRNLIAWSFYNPVRPIEVVDVVLTEDARKIQTQSISLDSVVYVVASIKSLIQMKSKSGRPQDLADVEALKKLKK